MATTLVKNAWISLRVRPGIVSSVRSLSSIQQSTFFPSNALSTPPLLLINSHKPNPMQASPLIFETGIPRAQIGDFLPQFNRIKELEYPTASCNEPLQAIKRTYQPSVLRRKRKHGFRTRRVSISGRKVLKRRYNKGRWRMSL